MGVGGASLARAAHDLTNITIGCVVLAALALQTFRGECIPCRTRKSYWAAFALYALLSVFKRWSALNATRGISLFWSYLMDYRVVAAKRFTDRGSIKSESFPWTERQMLADGPHSPDRR